MAAKTPAHVREQQINDIPGIKFVRWSGYYRGARSKAICRCEVDGYEWSARPQTLIRGKGCPQCLGVRRWTADDRESQINSRESIRFVRWVGRYQNANSRAVCQCLIDGFEWSASVSSLIHHGTGCPKCAGNILHDEAERIFAINAIPAITFIRWGSQYRGGRTKAIVKCANDGLEWGVRVTDLLNGNGCPQCAKYGYRPAKPGTLYVLRSECGSMVKIGISNDYEQRHSQLKRATPFDWSCIELLHGDGSAIAEFEKELHSWTEQAEFREKFDGYTEWRKWDARLPRWVERYRARLARIVAP